MNVLNGISGSVSTEVSSMVLGDGKVLDLKFLDNDSLLVLWAQRGKYEANLIHALLLTLRQTSQYGLLGYRTSPTSWATNRTLREAS